MIVYVCMYIILLVGNIIVQFPHNHTYSLELRKMNVHKNFDVENQNSGDDILF